jgi:DNA-directed RNA polymerase subunit RPC12/RpoP
MTCESCGAKVASNEIECPECGSTVTVKVTPKPPRARVATPARTAPRSRVAPLLTHGGALLVGVLLGAVLFGGPPKKTDVTVTGSGGGLTAEVPFAGHPAVPSGRKAPPLTEEQMRQGMPAGHVPMPPATGMGGESGPESRPAHSH